MNYKILGSAALKRHHPKMQSIFSPRRANLERTPKQILILTLALVLITISSLYYYSFLGQSVLHYEEASPPSSNTSTSSSTSASQDIIIIEPIRSARARARARACDVFRGEWVPNLSAPYYTNETCWAIHDHQNCMKHGRPDAEFMNWRWKPDGCDLQTFNPAQFLEIVRGKSLAFVGDSVGRNQMQSLICLLNRVTYAVDVSPTADEKFKRWSYPSHNFTLANFWSPFLVKAIEADPQGPTLTGLFNLYLDVPDANWTSHIAGFDYVIVSAGHWFFRPTMFYEHDTLKGCHYCLKPDVADLTMYHSYRMAFRTAFSALNSLSKFNGTTFLRTFAPSHFENGEWNKGGDCVRTRPLRSNETRLDGLNLEMYMIQVEEFRVAEREGRERGRKFRLLDTTDAMLLRPDGHPSRYGHRPEENVTMYNDCVHWCLPGPIDAWNDFLLHMLKTEGARSASAGRLPQIE